MSHFTVLTRLPHTVSAVDIDSELRDVFLPYKELGSATEGELPHEYLKFNDSEDEYRREYEKDSITMVRVPPKKGKGKGILVYPWDDRFKKPSAIGVGSDTHGHPKEWEVEIPFKDRYKTFSAFVNKYHNEIKDPRTNRYGYWSNPLGYWDWYTIGGRYRCRIPVVSVAHDFSIRAELDHYDIAELARSETPQYYKDRVANPHNADGSRIHNIDWKRANEEASRLLLDKV